MVASTSSSSVAARGSIARATAASAAPRPARIASGSGPTARPARSVPTVDALGAIRPGKTQVLQQLRDARDRPCLTRVEAEKTVAADALRHVDRTGDHEALTALLEGPAGRDQGPAPFAGLDDHGRVGKAADDPVPARERPRDGPDVRRKLGYDRAAACHDLVREVRMRPRVEAFMAGSEDRHGATAAGHRGGVRGTVDADGEPRHDEQRPRWRAPRRSHRRPFGHVRMPAASPRPRQIGPGRATMGRPVRTARAAEGPAGGAAPGTSRTRWSRP